jgi:hypothetical protein
MGDMLDDNRTKAKRLMVTRLGEGFAGSGKDCPSDLRYLPGSAATKRNRMARFGNIALPILTIVALDRPALNRANVTRQAAFWSCFANGVV